MASIEAKVSRGRPVWKVVVWHEKKRISRTFTVEQDAIDWRKLAEVSLTMALAELEEAAKGVRTVPEQVAHHIDHLTGVTQGTRSAYRKLAKNRIDDWFAHISITALDRDTVSAWVNDLEESGLSPKSIRNVHALLSASLASAVRSDLLPGNVAKGVRLPRAASQTRACFLTREQFAIAYNAVSERYRPLVLLLVGTGMRFGEATALQAGDINLDAHEILIRRAWKHGEKSGRVIGLPKTSKSLRTVAAPTQVIDELRALVKGKAMTDLVFTTTYGGPIRSSVWAGIWKPAADAVEKAAGIRPRTHDLRHTFASWAIQSGIPLPVLQRQLGHESITTTVDTYGHLARSDFDALAASTATFLPAPARELAGPAE